MASTSTPSTHRASFAIGNEQAAKRVVDLLTESFFEGQAAIAAFEGPGGRWDITVHFAEAPDQTSIRELVGIAAGAEVARDISFDTVEAKDWVKAALEELVPVRAGRFIVHGRHDRAKVPPNKLGIEIEAALAFGTGHHGTTRVSTTLEIWCRRSRRPGFQRRNSWRMARSIWCWRTFSPIRCGRWQPQWRGISHHQHCSFYRGCCRLRPVA